MTAIPVSKSGGRQYVGVANQIAFASQVIFGLERSTELDGVRFCVHVCTRDSVEFSLRSIFTWGILSS